MLCKDILHGGTLMIRAALTLLIVFVFATLCSAQRPRPPISVYLPSVRQFSGLAQHKYIVVVLKTQRLLTVEDEVITGNYHCSTGRPGMDTNVGTWKITEKIRHGRTFEAFGGDALEYELRVPTKTKKGRFRATSIHEYHSVPRHPASHGCIRLQHKSAPKVYAFGEVGMEVDVVERKPANLH